MSLTNFGRDYLLLCLRMNKVIDGFVDAYYGPLELKKIVEQENKCSPQQLIESCKSLQKQLNEQGLIEERIKFLEKTLGAIKTSLAIITGKEMPYLEEVYKLYDIKPELIDDSKFYDVAEELNSLYEGSGTLIERINKTKKRRQILPENLEETFSHAFRKIREKTIEIMPDVLPEGESISFQLVKDEPWSAYNWYLGNCISRIDINTDLPVQWDHVLKLVVHEGYPGHHTEHAVKEKLLYQDEQRFEHCILLIPTPEAVISEGIGNAAIDVLFKDNEKFKFAFNEFCLDHSSEDLENFIAQSKSWEKVRGLLNNVAIHAHVDGWGDDDLVNYAMEFGFFTEKYIRQNLKFIRHPLWSSYVFTYSFGEMLIKRKFGPNPRPEDFKILLTHPALPSDIV